MNPIKNREVRMTYKNIKGGDIRDKEMDEQNKIPVSC